MHPQPASPNRLTPLLFLVIHLSVWHAPPASTTAAEPRSRTSFDFDWRFHLGDVDGGPSVDLDDSQWQSVQVPHDWSAEQPFSQEYASGTGYLPGGIGWYRKSFDVPDDWRGKEVSLEFDGVYRDSQVWINGKLLGGRPFGYIPFAFRLTPHLRIGEENVVAVRVARENVADSRWYTGTGIYRHTWLTVTDPVHVERWGTFVTTPRVTDERADIMITNTIESQGDGVESIRVETQVLDADGEQLSRQSTQAQLDGGAKKTIAQWHVAHDPGRWSPETPVLYTTVTRVFVGDRLVDETKTPFGIRDFYFDPDEGFFLNGKPTLIKGLCMHHDAGVVGAAVPDGVLERRLRLVKSMGANAVRCSHNPMASELYSLCDQLGLLVMDEAFDEWELGKRKWVKGRNVGTARRYGYNVHFKEWAERDVADMVRRGRNHPSIILWSIGNEIDYPGDPYDHSEFFDPAAPPVDEGSPSATRLAVVAPQLIAAIKKHDPSRPVTMALSNMPAANGVGLAAMLDVCGYNYQERFYEQDHRDFPGRVIFGSENSRNPRSWRDVRDNDYISSLYLWVGFDFLGEAGPWPNHGSEAGVFDTRGFLKVSSWTYKTLWSDEPAIRMFVGRPRNDGDRRRRRRFGAAERPRLWAAPDGATVPVFIASNCDSVVLKVNGTPVDTEWSDRGGMFRADVPFEAGELRVECLDGERVVASDTLVTPGEPARLELVADRQKLAADGRDVAHVEVRIVDDGGVLVPDAEQSVTVAVTGEGRLLGLDNGDQNDPTPLKSPTKKSRDGRFLAIVQSTQTGGALTITATAEGLTSADLTMESE